VDHALPNVAGIADDMKWKMSYPISLDVARNIWGDDMKIILNFGTEVPANHCDGMWEVALRS
jgi:hypothetical protein